MFWPSFICSLLDHIIQLYHHMHIYRRDNLSDLYWRQQPLCAFACLVWCLILHFCLFTCLSVAVSVFNCLLVAEDVLMQLSYKIRGLDLDWVIATPHSLLSVVDLLLSCAWDHCPVRWLRLSEALAVRQVASHSTRVYFGTQQSSRSTQGNVPKVRSCACNKPKSSPPPPPCWQLIWGVCGDMLV